MTKVPFELIQIEFSELSSQVTVQTAMIFMLTNMVKSRCRWTAAETTPRVDYFVYVNCKQERKEESEQVLI